MRIEVATYQKLGYFFVRGFVNPLRAVIDLI
jgi:hypothetical protein